MSFVCALYHIVINTYNRSHNLSLQHSEELYSYIRGIIRGHNCECKAINGTVNHIHILIGLHPSVDLSELMRELKRSSNIWMRNNPHFAKFGGWGSEYFATTFAYRDLGSVKRYVENQREHHRCFDFNEELKRIVTAYGGEWMTWMEKT